MGVTSFKFTDDYWDEFELKEEDIEFLYDHLLDIETPQTPEELISDLVKVRINREIEEIEKQRLAGADMYMPKEQYEISKKLVFPEINWRQGEIIATRKGSNPEYGEFEVIKLRFDNGEELEFASALADHALNEPIDEGIDSAPDPDEVLEMYEESLTRRLTNGLDSHPDFVYIAGKWFPKALLIDIHGGHLNLAEAVLDMSGGGPLPTSELISQVDLPNDVNANLLEFSFDFALQEDERFDEIGPMGEVLWFLKRLEPVEVLEVPHMLQYQPVDYDRSLISQSMLALERELDDELSPTERYPQGENEVPVNILFPHLRSGTLPLTARVRPFFPTAYDTPRIRFMLVDGGNGAKFPGWVVQEHGYVFGLGDWYIERGLMPGSIIRVRHSVNQGEVIIEADTQRSSRDWVRTLFIGTDGGIVFAMLKQIVKAAYDERLAIAIPDTKAIDDLWLKNRINPPPFERIVVNIVRELTKLNPQSHVHISELYAAVNLLRRCPPGPIMGLLASRPWFVHVGDNHFRFTDSEEVLTDD